MEEKQAPKLTSPHAQRRLARRRGVDRYNASCHCLCIFISASLKKIFYLNSPSFYELS